VTLEAVSRYLRRFDKLSEHTDQVFVLDHDNRFKGVLPINLIVVNEPELAVSKLMLTETVTFYPDDKADHAAQSFERYGLLSAAVLDEDYKLLGRVTMSAITAFNRVKSEYELLNQSGLRMEEDIFASVWKSVQNRWLWLALNLCAAFIASRVISNFESSIEKLVSLAALLPIIAVLAVNSVHQTKTIMIRSMALGQINKSNARRMLSKELAISTLNGLVWGGLAGLFAYDYYRNVWLGLVLAGAILLSLVFAAVVGLLIPLAMHSMKLAQSTGSSVLLTILATSSSFFIFFGLATFFLIL
jgi:magnesium transporter